MPRADRTPRATTSRPPPRDPRAPSGLSSAVVAERLAADGPNELTRDRPRSALALLGTVMREPMLLLLVAAASIYLVLGDLLEGVALAVSIAVVIGITVRQEFRATRALEALRELSSPRAQVVRDGVSSRVAARDLVRGDLVVLAEGDRVPADLVLATAFDLSIDESLLTGESAPVPRGVGETVHASTLVVAGHAQGEVAATGDRTAVGAIGVAVARAKVERTPLERELGRLSRLFGGLALLACIAATTLHWWRMHELLPALLAGLTLAMAAIPEEFPVIVTVFLALGALRMSRQKVLTRRAAAIEALGTITVLCTDKTGTLTENRMRVVALEADSRRWREGEPFPPALRPLLDAANRASEVTPFDPMEQAIRALAAANALTPGEEESLDRHYPFEPGLLAHGHAWRTDAGTRLAAKGAAESIASLCAFDEPATRDVQAAVERYGRDGLRVIAVAEATHAGGELPASLRGFAWHWLGLVALEDPLRAAVPAAVEEARRAGVRTIMLTGDAPATAIAIARKAGIESDVAMTGAELEQLDDAALATTLDRVHVFARVRPEHKLRLVAALKRRGDVVAMTGDGVNDAPALKAAHVGVAMGGRGTDVARESASLVLLDDNFTSIVTAIRLGRGICRNIAAALRYVLAVHVPIVTMALLPLVVGGPLVLAPLHVVLIEFLIDPACTLVFERQPIAADTMRRPPRPPGMPLLPLADMVRSFGVGALLTVLTVAVYLYTWQSGWSAERTAWTTFASLIVGNVALIVLAMLPRGRARRQSRATRSR